MIRQTGAAFRLLGVTKAVRSIRISDLPLFDLIDPEAYTFCPICGTAVREEKLPAGSWFVDGWFSPPIAELTPDMVKRTAFYGRATASNIASRHPQSFDINEAEIRSIGCSHSSFLHFKDAE